jgi:hypothetical protein
MMIPSRCFVFNTPLTKSSAPPLAHGSPNRRQQARWFGVLKRPRPGIAGRVPAEPFEFGQRRVRRARIDGTLGIEYQIEIAIFHLIFSRVFSKEMQVEIEGLKEMAP